MITLPAGGHTDPNDLELSCAINGEQMQRGRTGDLIFSVPALIEKLSATLPLLPGDLIFTGTPSTPSGVGLGRIAPRWLAPGDELVSHIAGFGELRTGSPPPTDHPLRKGRIRWPCTA